MFTNGNFEVLGPSTAVLTFTSSNISGAQAALIGVEGATVRMRCDGTAPTSLVGIPLTTAAPPLFYVGELGKVQLYGASTVAISNVQYFK